MEKFLRDVFQERKFEYIVFRSLLIAILVTITANEYYKLLQTNKLSVLLFTLVLFFVVYTYYINRAIRK